jgi:type I restriction enzyme, S subunit
MTNETNSSRWEQFRFDEAVEPISDEGKRVDQRDYQPEGILPVIDQGEDFIGGYTNDLSKAYNGPLPIIVFGDHTRRVKLVNERFAVGAQGVKLLHPREGWDPKFFAYLLPTLSIPNRGYSRHYQFVRKLRFPRPDLKEQQCIVAEIEKQFTRLDAGVASLKRVQTALKRYRASVLKAACEGRLVPTEAELVRKENRNYETGAQLLQRILKARREKWNGKGKYKEPLSARIADGPKLPEGWSWATVEQLNPPDRPCAYGVLQPGPHVPHGIPIVRVGDINEGKVDQTTLKLISPKIAAQYPRTKLRGGEVAISLVGAIGRTAVIPETLAGANTARAVGIMPMSSLVTSAWVEIWFRNPRKIAEMTSKAHEVARKTLNLEDVRVATVAVPPLAEQGRIAFEVERRLSIVEELELAINANEQRASGLRQSVLQQAFSGGANGLQH